MELGCPPQKTGGSAVTVRKLGMLETPKLGTVFGTEVRGELEAALRKELEAGLWTGSGIVEQAAKVPRIRIPQTLFISPVLTGHKFPLRCSKSIHGQRSIILSLPDPAARKAIRKVIVASLDIVPEFERLIRFPLRQNHKIGAALLEFSDINVTSSF
jgi:hypothetical protein